MREETYGELRVLASAIEDEDVRTRLTRTATAKVLEEGTELRVPPRDQDRKIPLQDQPQIDLVDRPSGCKRFCRIRIGKVSRGTAAIDSRRGGLWIRQRGVGRTELLSSGVTMPEEFGSDNAHSLNPACTLLSERYEEHRISHTLNVYPHVFCLEKEIGHSRWRPLENLRTGVIADRELESVADAWRELEKLVGFPAPPG